MGAEPRPLDLLLQAAKNAFLEKQRRASTRKLDEYRPYPKQKAFHSAGAEFRERLLDAANQVGKTTAAAAELAYHLTGLYPEWWDGHRFERATSWIVGSETAEIARRGAQRILLGPPENERLWGTGMIPGDRIIEQTRKRGVPDAVESIIVSHVSGGSSTVTFKSYDQGRKKWQADTVDGVWFDEEPPEEIYSEGLTRTNAVEDGRVMTTFTPLLGETEIIVRFMKEDDAEAKGRWFIIMTLADAKHFSAARREEIASSYKSWERDARVSGTPTLGSGRVYPVSWETVSVDPFPIPKHWRRIIGLDFGGSDHPFAAIELCWDTETDIIYATKEYIEVEPLPAIHAAAILPWGDWVPVAWPHDGHKTSIDRGSALPLRDMYENEGLEMLDDHATHEDGGGYGVEAGITEILSRMRTGRLKIFKTLSKLEGEFLTYHREKGIIVKKKDDGLDALRTGMMMLRESVAESELPPPKTPGDQAGGGFPGEALGGESSWMG